MYVEDGGCCSSLAFLALLRYFLYYKKYMNCAVLCIEETTAMRPMEARNDGHFGILRQATTILEWSKHKGHPKKV